MRQSAIARVTRANNIILICAIVLVAGLTTWISAQLSVRYRSELTGLTLLNSYILSVNEVANSLDAVMRDGEDVGLERYDKSSQSLSHSALSLCADMPHAELWRYVTDLKYMAETYLYESRCAARLMNAGYQSAALPIYETCTRLYGLINSFYRDCYGQMLDIIDRSQNEMISYQNTLYCIGCALIALLLLVFSLLSRRVQRKIAMPIETLDRNMSNAVSTTGHIDIAPTPKTGIMELDSLVGSFEGFVSRCNGQFDSLLQSAEIKRRLYEEENKNLRTRNQLKNAELRTLQSRINPHFMFNSLNMITSSAYLEGASQTSGLLEALGGFLRYNLDKFDRVVTLADEFENVRGYFYIQSIRMGERIRYEMELDERAKNARIPCLIVQPLVENSIIHGVGQYLENGVVGVSAKREENRVILSVYDNGKGMDTETLDKVYTMFNGESAQDTDDEGGIGLRNVMLRLKLYYEDDVRIRFFSDPGIRTELIFDIPYQLGEENT